MFGNVYIFISLVISICCGNIDLNVGAFRSLNTNISKCNGYLLIPIKLSSISSLQIHVISTKIRDGHTPVMSEKCWNASKYIFSTTMSYTLHVIQFKMTKRLEICMHDTFILILESDVYINVLALIVVHNPIGP